MAIIVDPLDEEAITFYTKYGFITLPDSAKMFLPMQTVANLFKWAVWGLISFILIDLLWCRISKLNLRAVKFHFNIIFVIDGQEFFARLIIVFPSTFFAAHAVLALL